MARTAVKTDVAFRGFGPKAFAFFRSIEFYQSKQWFTENKPIYETEALQPMSNLVLELSKEMRGAGLPLAGDPKTSLFRIHRDVRFSKDKTPYRTHIGATLSRDGRKLSPGMLYMHIAPEGSFLAMGTYHPLPEELKGLRDAMVKQPKRWLKIIEELKKTGLVLSEQDMLTRMPHGYEDYADSPIARSLRQRSLIVRRPLKSSSLGNRKLIKEIMQFAQAGKAFLEFTWSAVDRARAEK